MSVYSWNSSNAKPKKFRSSVDDYAPTPYRDSEDILWSDNVTIEDVCKGLTVLECAKTMNRERNEVVESEKDRNRSYVKINLPGPSSDYKFCNTDKECKEDSSEICLENLCVPKQSFPLTLRQQKLQQQKLENKMFSLNKNRNNNNNMGNTGSTQPLTPTSQQTQNVPNINGLQQSSTSPYLHRVNKPEQNQQNQNQQSRKHESQQNRNQQIQQNKKHENQQNKQSRNQKQSQKQNQQSRNQQQTGKMVPNERYSPLMSPRQYDSYWNLKTSSMGNPTPNRMVQSQYTMFDNMYLKDWTSLQLPPMSGNSRMYPRTHNIGNSANVNINANKMMNTGTNEPAPQFTDFFPLRNTI